MRRAFLHLMVFGLVWSVALAVEAEGRPSLLEDHKPGRPSAALELELGYRLYEGGGETAHFLAPSLDFRFAFSTHAELTLDWPLTFFAFSREVGRGDSSFKSGNPSAILYYVGHIEQGFFRIGGGVAFPVAHVSSPGFFPASAVAYAGAAEMNGFYDMYRYLPDTLSLIFPLQLQLRRGPLVLGGDGALIATIPTRGTDNDMHGVFQLAGLIGGRVDNVTLGARLQVAWRPARDFHDAQTALVPFVQGDFSGGGFVYARLVLDLDEPFGLFAKNTGILGHAWGFFLGGGSRF